MQIYSRLDQFHSQVKANKWLRYFAIFNRLVLAAGFFPAGMVKIIGERFASGLSPNHPMGHYLVALHQTGYYYTAIGYLQVAAAILLLIPQTAILGALIYFPIILNIWILTLATRFDGSLFTSPLMVLANLYLLGWYYDRIKYLFPFNRPPAIEYIEIPGRARNKFPLLFFSGVAVMVFLIAFVTINGYTIRPRNSFTDCETQAAQSRKPKATMDFCDCIHNRSQPLDSCLLKYNMAPVERNKQ